MARRTTQPFAAERWRLRFYLCGRERPRVAPSLAKASNESSELPQTLKWNLFRQAVTRAERRPMSQDGRAPGCELDAHRQATQD